MKNLNIEIKAHCKNQDEIRNILKKHNAEYKGTDHQIDTYFNCSKGRLKLREGNIEYSLVSYQRKDQPGPKRSDVIYYRPRKDTPLKDILTTSLGILVTVVKSREIYFIENVKFHLDRVEKLGDFVEIEAIDKDGSRGETALQEQCKRYIELFSIQEEDLIDRSYSDLLLENLEKNI